MICSRATTESIGEIDGVNLLANWCRSQSAQTGRALLLFTWVKIQQTFELLGKQGVYTI